MSAIVAAAGAAFLGGCAEQAAPQVPGPGVYPAMTAAAVATVGTPGPQDIPFGEALVTFSRELGELHGYQGEQADPSIRNEILWLAAILERMPAASTQPHLRRTAGQIRAAEEARPEDAPISVEETKRELALVAAALLMVARHHYGDDPEIGRLTRRFAGAVGEIDAKRSPPDRAGVVNALVRAERALAAMYASNAR